MANVVSGNPTYFMNIAQMTEQTSNPYLTTNAPGDLTGTQEGSGMTWITNKTYSGVYGNENRWEAQSSRAGRIRYVLDPQGNTHPNSFSYTEQGDGSGGTFTVDFASVANSKQHDDVIYCIGTRSKNCDGMSNHNEFGKSAGNCQLPDTAYGHVDSHFWADGCLYTHILDNSSTNFSNYHRLNSYAHVRVFPDFLFCSC